jgi:hypothetical protein
MSTELKTGQTPNNLRNHCDLYAPILPRRRPSHSPLLSLIWPPMLLLPLLPIVMAKFSFRASHTALLWFCMMVMLRFLSRAAAFLTFPPPPPLLLFALNLPCRLTAVADAFLGLVNSDLLLLLLHKQHLLSHPSASILLWQLPVGAVDIVNGHDVPLLAQPFCTPLSHGINTSLQGWSSSPATSLSPILQEHDFQTLFSYGPDSGNHEYQLRCK